MTCLYCGAPSANSGPVNVCICGRSGSWQVGYRPKLIECNPQFDTPDWLRAARRAWYTRHPQNERIVADALASRDAPAKQAPKEG